MLERTYVRVQSGRVLSGACNSLLLAGLGAAPQREPRQRLAHDPLGDEGDEVRRADRRRHLANQSGRTQSPPVIDAITSRSADETRSASSASWPSTQPVSTSSSAP